MRIEALKNDRIADFTAYCLKHRKELDDSFLYDEDLRDFEPNEENPTYIAVNEQENIVAAASLIINKYMRSGRKARFRIFHSETGDLGLMSKLMGELLKHTEGLDLLFIFVPVVNTKLLEAVESLRFELDRYSFLLVREDLEVPEVHLPEGYEIRAFQQGTDEEAWCKVRNASFATLKGSETPVTADMISKMVSEDDYIEGGMMLLYHEGRAVGAVRGAKDEYEDAPIMNIGPLAIIPEYQGKGLGRALLRASLCFAEKKGYQRTVLCVNAENERAKVLYIQEGFKQVEAVACYDFRLGER